MSPRQRKFDRFMVDVNNGGNSKIGRLTDGEYRAHFAGILPIAAQAPVRGRLLIGDEEATADDIARKACVPVKVAQSAVEKLRRLGVIVSDDELRCEQIHDWEDWNPSPKTDKTNAERQRRYRDRRNAMNNGTVTAPVTVPVLAVTGVDVTPTEVEVEVEVEVPPVTPPKGPSESTGRRPVRYGKHIVPVAALAVAEHVLDAYNAKAGQRVGAWTGRGVASDALKTICGFLIDRPDETPESTVDLVIVTIDSKWWKDGPPSIGVIFGAKVVEANIARRDHHEADETPKSVVAAINARQQHRDDAA